VPRDRRHDPFLKAIDADPLDAAPHLIYADWLTENGFEDEAQEHRFRGSILSDPYDAGVRWKYAEWLFRHDRKAEGWQEQWLAAAFSGKSFRGYDVYTRRTIPDRGYWGRRLQELFRAHPEILVIVVGEGYLANSGFRHDRGRWKHNPLTGTRTRVGFKSPILYYRKASRAHGGGCTGAWVA
jgi:uncharacterized protein (TIGR02996 family)